jgi:hypothetical protein
MPATEQFRDSAVRSLEHLGKLVGAEDGVTVLPRLYDRMKREDPSLTPEQFRRQILSLANDRVVEMQRANDLANLQGHHLGVMRGEHLYYYVSLRKPPATGAKSYARPDDPLAWRRRLRSP